MFNQPGISKQCRKLEARWEDYLAGAPDSELESHLSRCAPCRSMLEDSRFAGHLLREAWQPASEPSRAFLANVMSRIRQEEARAKSPAAFWTPLEFLASRLSVTAAVILLALSVYLVEFGPRRIVVPASTRTELSTNDFPQPPGDPVSNEDVLLSLSERNYGR